jgi:ATP/maltotriose-dependent transcriptional regulator MalT
MSKVNTFHRPYRSPMASVLEQAENVKGNRKKKIWSLQDILRAKKVTEKVNASREKREAVIQAAKDRLAKSVSNRRVTVIKRVKAGYHATGIGEILSTSLDQIKETARNAGYTHLRVGKSNRFIATK